MNETVRVSAALAQPAAPAVRATTQPAIVAALAALAPEWFRALEWLGVTAAVHVLATWTDSTLLVAAKWICYLMLFTWMSYKVDQGLQWIFRRSSQTEAQVEPMHQVIAVGLGGTMIPMLYIFVQYLAIVLIARLGS
ncbi:MAG TPA: hypothetical protein VNF69_07250 [Burkholderiales bacterium]|nr:hypothetical protein [Burkholderiales bacterium]